MGKWLVLLIMLACPVSAKTLWSDFSLTYLNGRHYEVGDPHRQVATFEYATGTTWGNAFLFFDHLQYADGQRDTYGEFSPRLYLYQFDKSSFIQDVTLSGTVEMGQAFTHYLYGLGTALKMPGFNYFKLDFYRRDNDGYGNSWQMTTTWAYPFHIGNSEWLYDGFLDWSSAVSADNIAASANFTSQLKWNLAGYFDLQSPLYVGVEYAYWKNKFSIQGVTENNVNLLIKWHF